MERERRGDAGWDGAQQNTCHIWSEENNNKLDQLANARKRGTILDASPLQLLHGRQQSWLATR